MKKSKSLYIGILYRNINIPERYKMTQTTQIERKERIQHSPTLNTVLMVESVLKEAGGVLTVADLKRRLPKKVMHQTLLQIIDYLQISGKILIGTKGILWIYAERKELEELMKRGTEL